MKTHILQQNRSPVAKNTFLAMAFLCVVIILANFADARVFMRFRRSGNVIEPAQMGWNDVLSCEFVIDGVASNVQVLSSRSSAAATFRRLEAVYSNRGARFAGASGRELAWGVAELDGLSTRIMIIAPFAMNSTLVFLFHDQETAPRRIGRSMPSGIPDFPGARIARTAARPRTGLEVAFLQTHTPPEDVLSFYARTMEGEGWEPLLPDRSGRHVRGSLLFFRKGNRISCISADSSGGGMPNVITVLSKDSGV